MEMDTRNQTNSRHFRLKRGLDLHVAGASAAATLARDVHPVRSVALTGADFAGIRAELKVAVGDRVTLGQALFHDRRDPALLFTSPAPAPSATSRSASAARWGRS